MLILDRVGIFLVSRGSSQGFAVVFCANFLALPVHTGSATVIDLHAIHADVAFTGFGVARDDTRKGDKPTRVFGPALEDGKPVEREVVFSDDFLTGAARHRLGEEL